MGPPLKVSDFDVLGQKQYEARLVVTKLEQDEQAKPVGHTAADNFC